MPIFGIIMIAFLFALMAAMFTWLAYIIRDSSTRSLVNSTPWVIAGIIVSVLMWAGATCVGISINEGNERLFIADYEAQKTTIESSLDSETLTSFERIRLVKQASELNGKLAMRKRKYDIWYYVTYDEGLYDNVEPIEMK